MESDAILKFKKFLSDKELEYQLYLDEVANSKYNSFKDILDFCNEDPLKMIDYDAKGEDDFIKDRTRLNDVIELYVKMALSNDKLKLNDYQSEDNIVSNYINILEIYRSLKKGADDLGIDVDSIEQSHNLKKQIGIFYHDLKSIYDDYVKSLKSEKELLALKSTCETAANINSVIQENGDLLVPFDDISGLFRLMESSDLSLVDKKELLFKFLPSSIEAFKIIEPEKGTDFNKSLAIKEEPQELDNNEDIKEEPEKEIDFKEYLTDDEKEIITKVEEIINNSGSEYKMLNNSPDLKTYVDLYNELLINQEDIVDGYFGNYSKDEIARLACLNNIRLNYDDFKKSVIASGDEPEFIEYKYLCYSQLLSSIDSFEAMNNDEDIEVLDLEEEEVNKVIYLTDSKHCPYIEKELESTYNNRDYYNKVSNMVSLLKRGKDGITSIKCESDYPVLLIRKGALAVSYIDLGNNVLSVITMGSVSKNDDIYSKTKDIINKEKDIIHNMHEQVFTEEGKQALIDINEVNAASVISMIETKPVKKGR